MKKQDLAKYIRSIPDFPKAGILFKDITTLLADKDAFSASIDLMAQNYKHKKIDAIVAVEARGFIFGGALAYKLGTSFVPVRKKGKLPYKTLEVTYDLEYGQDTLTIHEDAFKPGANILIIDDLLATGGTVKAVCDLVAKLAGNIIDICFLIELTELKGREKLGDLPVFSLIKY
ncbi:MAG: adenine phosphoribosyltransferase [Candidatus Omnitrophica bacterium]|nr:adenine phosphoribosyltransferase [Candidatus Omnitrophota bacterium]